MHIKEAELKLCPLIKESCHTSRCMMWVFRTIYKDVPGAPYLSPRPEKESETDGNCGLIK